MSEIRVTLVCGCTVAIARTDPAPVCATHQERRVARTQAPTPQFVARDCDAKGPLVTHG